MDFARKWPVGETPGLGPWRKFLERRHAAETKEPINIALVGKYDLQDAYKSIREALSQAGTYNDRKVEVHFVNSEKLTDENVAEALKGMAGVMIGPGFVNVVSTANLLPSNTHVHMIFRPSVSVWVCNVSLSNLPATCWDMPMPTRVKWMKRLRTT